MSENLNRVKAAFASATSARDYGMAKREMGRLSIPDQYATCDEAIAACRRLRGLGVL